MEAVKKRRGTARTASAIKNRESKAFHELDRQPLLADALGACDEARATEPGLCKARAIAQSLPQMKETEMSAEEIWVSPSGLEFQ